MVSDCSSSLRAHKWRGSWCGGQSCAWNVQKGTEEFFNLTIPLWVVDVFAIINKWQNFSTFEAVAKKGILYAWGISKKNWEYTMVCQIFDFTGKPSSGQLIKSTETVRGEYNLQDLG